MVAEHRTSTRKILKVKALLALDGRPPVMGRTGDIGATGVSVNFPDPVPAGQAGQVRFDLVMEGKVTPVNARAKVLNCIFSNGQFKVGLLFEALDAATSSALTRFLR